MKLYTTPGGQWAGTEKDWKAAMKAEGIDTKTYAGRKQVEVPTSKAELMEFLTFHNVNVVNPGTLSVVGAAGTGASPPAPVPAASVDVEALRALHNPEASPGFNPELAPPPPPATTMPDLDELFEAAPLARQLHLASLACENARNRIR